MGDIEKKKVNREDLDIAEESRLVWVRVRDAAELAWADNLKLHDLGGIIQSLVKYGYQDKARYDETLGAIKHGNGRTMALREMEKSGDYDPPRGVAVLRDSGEWAYQLDVGVDATSENEAVAYAIDANNLTLMGGDYGIADIMAVWDVGLLDQLNKLGEEGQFSVSITADDLDALNDWENTEFPEFDEDAASDVKRTTCPECGHEWVE
jgi:hypothetical protein